jgi:hypothetical protein
MNMNPMGYYPSIPHPHGGYMPQTSMPPNYYPGYPPNVPMPVGMSGQHGIAPPLAQHPLAYRPPYNMYGVPTPMAIGGIPSPASMYGHPSNAYGIPPPGHLYPNPYMNPPMYNPNMPNPNMGYALN